AEFVTKFDVVLACLPGNVVDVVPVGVHTVPRIAFIGAQLRKTGIGDGHDRQSEVEGIVGVRRVRADGVQTDGGRIKTAIFGIKPFRKSVPSQSGLVHDRRSKDAHKGNRDKLDARGRIGVVARNKPATAQSQWKVLRAIPKVIAAGKEIVFIDVVIHFHDGAIHAIREGSGQRGIGPAVVVAVWGICAARRRPGLASTDELFNNGVNPGFWCIVDDVLGCWYARGTALRSTLARALVIGKKESFVLHNRSAQGTAKLIIVERLLGTRVDGIEIVPRIRNSVAEKFQPRAVPTVGAAIGDDVDHGAAAAAIFGLEVGSHAKFGDGFNRENGGGRAEYTGFVDGRVVSITVVHIRAVKQEVVGAAPGTVDGKGAVGAGRV